MYQQHFGLAKPIFDSGIAQGLSVFISDEHAVTADNMNIALTSQDSVIVLCGPAGIGKTTIAARTLRMTDTRVAAAWLPIAPLSPQELLELLLAEFGFDPYKHSRVERLQIWRQFLTELGATGSRVFIAVEHADEIAVGVLHALGSLTVSDPNGCPGANIVLMGHAGLSDVLHAPTLQNLRQRVRLLRRFEPLDVDAVEAYLRHCVCAAGGTFETLFAPEAAAALHAYSDGIPRVINNLCETALALAATRGEALVTAAAIASAAVDICGLAPLGNSIADQPAAAIVIPMDFATSAQAEAPAHAAVDAAESGQADAPMELHGLRIASGAVAPPYWSSFAATSIATGGDDIPVLTESVDFDVGSEPGSVPLSDAELDRLSAELAEAILSEDEPEAPVSSHDEPESLTASIRDEPDLYAMPPTYLVVRG